MPSMLKNVDSTMNCSKECVDCNHNEFVHEMAKGINVCTFTCINGTLVNFKYNSPSAEAMQLKLQDFFKKKGGFDEQTGSVSDSGSGAELLQSAGQ